MLAKKYKLKKKKEIDALFKTGKSQDSRLLKIKWNKNNLNINRFIFAVSTKISKKATQRNKIKRKLEEIIRNNYQGIKQGYDLAIIAKPEIINTDYQLTRKELMKLLEKMCFLNQHNNL